MPIFCLQLWKRRLSMVVGRSELGKTELTHETLHIVGGSESHDLVVLDQYFELIWEVNLVPVPRNRSPWRLELSSKISSGSDEGDDGIPIDLLIEDRSLNVRHSVDKALSVLFEAL